jgi:hypothetical protein
MVQRDRVLNTDEAHALDRQMDAMQFVIALRNFVRAVEAIQALRGAQSGKALGAFTEVVPRWKHVRDVIEQLRQVRGGEGKPSERWPARGSVTVLRVGQRAVPNRTRARSTT